MTRRIASFLVLVAGLVMLAGCTAPNSPSTLTVSFERMAPYIGHVFEARLFEEPSGTEIAGIRIDAVESDRFEFQFVGLGWQRGYAVEFFADVNGNGKYDAPPGDHAWSAQLPPMSGSGTWTFSPNENITDLGWVSPDTWPPSTDGLVASPDRLRGDLGLQLEPADPSVRAKAL